MQRAMCRSSWQYSGDCTTRYAVPTCRDELAELGLTPVDNPGTAAWCYMNAVPPSLAPLAPRHSVRMHSHKTSTGADPRGLNCAGVPSGVLHAMHTRPQGGSQGPHRSPKSHTAVKCPVNSCPELRTVSTSEYSLQWCSREVLSACMRCVCMRRGCSP